MLVPRCLLQSCIDPLFHTRNVNGFRAPLRRSETVRVGRQPCSIQPIT